MKWLLDLENPVMRSLGTVADLMVMNLLTIVCCLPVVTIGAALTALNATVIKVVRGEEGALVRGYFRSFRQNFPKGSALGLFFLLTVVMLWVDGLMLNDYLPVLRPVFLIMALLVLTLGQYAFAMFARYENTLRGTLKNALCLAVGYFPKTIGMTAFTVAFWLLPLQFLSCGVPILFFFGLSLPCYVSILLMQSIFANLEK